MKKNTLIILFIINCFFCFSQNEANNWYFGENAGLDFNNGNPTILTNGQLNTGEGCASISDANGNLLFYTDGKTVYNAQHSVMLNGNDLNGDFSSSHSAIVVPKPNSSNIYYIFTADDDAGEFGLQYSEVDMNLDAGLGGITTNKNIPLYTPITEKLTAIKHATLNEYWVISHKYGNNEFLVYRISENGVDSEPIISATGLPITPLFDKGNTRGQIKVSPDGTKLAVARSAPEDENGGVELLDFNPTTGQVSNPISIPITYNNFTASPYGIEFSPDSKILYVSSGVGIFQYDLTSTTIGELLLSQYTVVLNTDSAYGYGGIQLGPNGRIYIAEWDNLFLHVISEPNNLGEECEYMEDGLYLGSKISRLGLPPFIQSFFFVGFQVENLCESDTTMFTANVSQTYDSILWDFGDGNTSIEENPSHVYNNSGEYEVKLTVISGTNTSSETKYISINETPIVAPIIEFNQCDDDLDGFSNFNLNGILTDISENSDNETITFYKTLFNAQNRFNQIFNTASYVNETASSDEIWARVENSNGCYNFSQIMLTVSTTQIPSSFIREFYQCDTGLDTNDGITTFDFSSIIPEIESLFPNNEEIVLSFYRSINDALLETNQILDITNYENIGSPNTQGIFVRVDSTINNTCLGLGEHISLNVVSIPQISTLPEEIFLCRGDSTELIADNLYDSYNWSSGQSTQSIIISEAGEYTVTATKTIDGITCSTSKTVNVIETEAATLLGFETVDWTQNQNIITVFVEGSGDYEFSIDGINYQDSNIFTNLQPKEFTVYIREKNGCGIVSGSTYLLSYPKFFTPNGDGKNDFWQIKNSNREPLNKISIYNRYGKLLATLRSNSIGWDGSYNGNKLPTSDYWFVLKRQDGRVYTSHFTLKR